MFGVDQVIHNLVNLRLVRPRVLIYIKILKKVIMFCSVNFSRSHPHGPRNRLSKARGHTKTIAPAIKQESRGTIETGRKFPRARQSAPTLLQTHESPVAPKIVPYSL